MLGVYAVAPPERVGAGRLTVNIYFKRFSLFAVTYKISSATAQ